MEWIILEALVALAAGVAIVWWTMSARRPDRSRRDVRTPGDTDERGRE
jgi:hypothetical protein